MLRVVLRHYAFTGHWFKVNVTTDLSGRLTETGDSDRRFAVNCDIATPIEREAGSTFGVDLCTDVLVRDDATSYVITGQDELGEMLGRGVISPAEGRGAKRGLRELLDLIEAGAASGVARRARPVRAVPASPGAAHAARPGARPPAAGHPQDLVTPAVWAG
jgi:hypothetical protein